MNVFKTYSLELTIFYLYGIQFSTPGTVNLFYNIKLYIKLYQSMCTINKWVGIFYSIGSIRNNNNNIITSCCHVLMCIL